MEQHQYNAEEAAERFVASLRRTNEIRSATSPLIQESADRVSGTSQPIVTYFDWDGPELAAAPAHHHVTFLARVRYQTRQRQFRIPIDVTKLAAAAERIAELETILRARRDGLDDRHSLLRSLQWMLDISLEQTSPQLTKRERHLKVRQLLLAEPLSATPAVPGVSPFLPWVKQRARNQLWKNHHIDIDELERESIQLNIGLQQFEKIPAESDFQARADVYTEKLIAHHNKVKQAGKLLGGQLGDALVTLADLAIEWLLKTKA
jgi:hypothetical protein